MDLKLFSADTYAQRRTKLIAALPESLIWIDGHGESPMNYADNVYPFRQNSNFLYYAGIDLPGLSLLIDAGSGRSYLCGDEHTTEMIVWTGPQPSMSEMASRCGCEGVLTINQLRAKLTAASNSGALVHYLPPFRGESILRTAEWLTISTSEVKAKASQQLIELVICQRSIKEQQEVEAMSEAMEITRQMHLEFFYQAKEGIFERDLVASVKAVAHRHDVAMAYPVILTVHGQFLHNCQYHNLLQKDQLVLGDFGAESRLHYAADITRTVPVAATFDDQQREIYQIVLSALEAGTAMCAAGVPYIDVHHLAGRVLCQGLIDLGLMQGNAEEAVAEGAHALFFPHGIGHMIGLDVHDMEDLGEDMVGYGTDFQRSKQFGLRSLRLARQLEPGFAITVEPGIYFIPQLIDKWRSQSLFDQFINYQALNAYRHMGGIRVEDCVLITAAGCSLIGPEVPKRLSDIEFLRTAS